MPELSRDSPLPGALPVNVNDLERAAQSNNGDNPLGPRAMIRARAYAGSRILLFSEVDVSHGAVLLLRGLSGCGKSTWLALMAALVAATTGELMLGG